MLCVPGYRLTPGTAEHTTTVVVVQS